eukprot:gene4184-14283_t
MSIEANDGDGRSQNTAIFFTVTECDEHLCSIPYGTFLCLTCAGHHRSLGVHISFVRSTNLDSWTQDQLKMMALGGNGRYTSRAAQLYKACLEKEAAKMTAAAAAAALAAP